MKQSPILIITSAALFLVGCTNLGSVSAPTRRPTATSGCDQSGTTRTEQVFFPDRAETHAFTVYLPPCYAGELGSAYPVLYWTSAGGQGNLASVDRLIRQGDLPAFIFVMVEISPTQGFGADTQIIHSVVPYIDSHYHTQPDRLHRSITGISHGAAIAARAAFQAPDIFGRVAVISGGISEGEQEKFTRWIQATPPDQRPAIWIDVGDQDGIITLTRYLTQVLDKLGVSYTFTQGHGNHASEYWSSRMADYLKWLVPAQ